jgi:hypothetical protein
MLLSLFTIHLLYYILHILYSSLLFFFKLISLRLYIILYFVYFPLVSSIYGINNYNIPNIHSSFYINKLKFSSVISIHNTSLIINNNFSYIFINKLNSLLFKLGINILLINPLQ